MNSAKKLQQFLRMQMFQWFRLTDINVDKNICLCFLSCSFPLAVCAAVKNKSEAPMREGEWGGGGASLGVVGGAQCAHGGGWVVCSCVYIIVAFVSILTDWHLIFIWSQVLKEVKRSILVFYLNPHIASCWKVTFWWISPSLSNLAFVLKYKNTYNQNIFSKLGNLLFCKLLSVLFHWNALIEWKTHRERVQTYIGSQPNTSGTYFQHWSTNAIKFKNISMLYPLLISGP